MTFKCTSYGNILPIQSFHPMSRPRACQGSAWAARLCPRRRTRSPAGTARVARTKAGAARGDEGSAFPHRQGGRYRLDTHLDEALESPYLRALESGSTEVMVASCRAGSRDGTPPTRSASSTRAFSVASRKIRLRSIKSSTGITNGCIGTFLKSTMAGGSNVGADGPAGGGADFVSWGRKQLRQLTLHQLPLHNLFGSLLPDFPAINVPRCGESPKTDGFLTWWLSDRNELDEPNSIRKHKTPSFPPLTSRTAVGRIIPQDFWSADDVDRFNP